MGETAPTRFYMGETAPNAGLQEGDRKGWGNPPPTRVIVKVIEKAIAGYLYYLYGVLKKNWVFLKIENYNLSTSFCFFKNFKSFLEITK